MIRLGLLVLSFIFCSFTAKASTQDFMKYFKIDMQMEIPDVHEYSRKLLISNRLYDKGYISRYEMGTMFKKEFSKTIKSYGLSEGRIKSSYEDDLLEMISWLPKETYPYIGPMLHEVPGMSEKILNLPGIKETKNKFPEDIAEPFVGMEGIEYLSPALYFILMPKMWDNQEITDIEQPQSIPVKKPKVRIELPDFLKEKIGLPLKVAEKKQGSVKRKASLAQQLGLRTIHPTLVSPLTKKDVESFVATLDELEEWAEMNDMQNYAKLINGEYLLNAWEKENGQALMQNDLKDVVNPCQRIVLKTRFAEIYEDFAGQVSKQGFTPEEWAYTCDKTIKAFRIAEADIATAYAIRYHRRGYYKQYIDKLPKKWQEGMQATEAAIIKMYSALQQDVDVVRPYKNQIKDKFIKMQNVFITAPVIY